MEGLINLINCYYYYRHYAEGRSVCNPGGDLPCISNILGCRFDGCTGSGVGDTPELSRNSDERDAARSRVLESVSTSLRSELTLRTPGIGEALAAAIQQSGRYWGR